MTRDEQLLNRYKKVMDLQIRFRKLNDSVKVWQSISVALSIIKERINIK